MSLSAVSTTEWISIIALAVVVAIVVTAVVFRRKSRTGKLRTSSATLSTRGPLPKTAIGVRLKRGWQGGRSESRFQSITPWSSKTIGPLTKSLFGRLRGTQTQIASGDGSPPNPFRGTGAGAYGNCREGYGLTASSLFAAAPKH